MKSGNIFLIAFVLFISVSVSVFAQASGDEKKEFSSYGEAQQHSEQKLRQTLFELGYNPKLHPAHTNRETGKWERDTMKREAWTSGFFAGSLWYMYKLTGDVFWRDHAIEWTKDLEAVASYVNDHDTGFRIFNSHGNAYQIEDGRYYLKTVLQAALTLSKRYNPEIGAIKSWDWVGNYPVIIDNLMNLELLFWSADVVNRDAWYNMALRHAETTLNNHLREDGSTYHVVDFDNSGNVNWKKTFQGYGSESTWSRGQSWAVYGFTMIYKYTQKGEFLDAAKKAAHYFIENLPDDNVPPYDFLEPEPSVKTKDASAAAITASGLFQLYSITNNVFYFNTAVDILESLSSGEYSTFNSDMSSILKKSTIQRGRGNVGTSYADYYYLEAIIRYREIMNEPFPVTEKKPVFFLDQNYPNPFNNSTVIYYSIEEEGQVDLSVYNLAGRKVQTLINQFRSSGTYRTNFDASGLSSGVYLYRLNVNGRAVTKKMILLQ